MIIINQNTSNTTDLTLAEKKLNNTDVYLFEFINQVSNEFFYCIGLDKSYSQYRFNRFCLKHKTGTIDPTAGEINMKLEGFYRYNIYENPNSVLLPAGLNLCETGKMKCIGAPTITKTFEPSNTTKKVFNPKDYN